MTNCPEAGTVSQGKTIEKALANLKEATELVLEESSLKEFNRPLLTTFDVSLPERDDKKVREQPVNYMVEENKRTGNCSLNRRMARILRPDRDRTG